METMAQRTVARAHVAQPAASRLCSVRSTTAIARAIQAYSLTVSSPHDHAEHEAEATAQRVMGMHGVEPYNPRLGTLSEGLFRSSPYINRFADSGILVQRAGSRAVIQRQSAGDSN